MPTRTQSNTAPAGHTLAVPRLERLRGEREDDSLEYEMPYKRRSPPAGPLCREIEFEAIRDAPGHARRQLVAALRRRGYSDVLVQDAALVLTELAANAIVHAGSPFCVSVSLGESTLRIEVADREPLDTGPDDQAWVPCRRHGLGLIDALCTRWGTDITVAGKIVWGELPL
jgi:hypothetical protein